MRSSSLNVMLFCGILGLAAGVGIFTFIYAKGYSYLTDDPSACANCHLMDEYYDAWLKGSHTNVAVCNDCHTPHTVVGKYVTKASNGFWHSFAFTTGDFPDPLTTPVSARPLFVDRLCQQSELRSRHLLKQSRLLPRLRPDG